MKYSAIIIFSSVIIKMNAVVGPIIPGERLWNITERIGTTTDTIEEKVCNIEIISEVVQESTQIIESKLCNLVSSIDLVDACAPIPLFNVPGGQTISEPGFYCLVEDIQGTLEIEASCVTVDLNEHKIQNGGNNNVLIVDQTDIILKNGVIRDAPNGINASGSSRIKVDSINFISQGIGLIFEQVQSCIISNCIFTDHGITMIINNSTQIKAEDCCVRLGGSIIISNSQEILMDNISITGLVDDSLIMSLDTVTNSKFQKIYLGSVN